MRQPDDQGVRRARPRGRAGLGPDRPGRRRRHGARSATTRIPRRSARTFRVIDGVRYSFPGDMAQIAADGTLILLGSRQQRHQFRGREDLPGGGRGGGQARRRRHRLPRGRRRRRRVRSGRDGRRCAGAGSDCQRVRRDRQRQDPDRRFQGPEASGVRVAGPASTQRQGGLQARPRTRVWAVDRGSDLDVGADFEHLLGWELEEP